MAISTDNKKKAKISNLNDLRIILDSIPESTLQDFVIGRDEDGIVSLGVTPRTEKEEEDRVYAKNLHYYPQLIVINQYIKNIISASLNGNTKIVIITSKEPREKW
jgi:hypothetical protein